MPGILARHGIKDGSDREGFQDWNNNHENTNISATSSHATMPSGCRADVTSTATNWNSSTGEAKMPDADTFHQAKERRVVARDQRCGVDTTSKAQPPSFTMAPNFEPIVTKRVEDHGQSAALNEKKQRQKEPVPSSERHTGMILLLQSLLVLYLQIQPL